MSEQFPPNIQAALDLAFGITTQLNGTYRDLLLRCESTLKSICPGSFSVNQEVIMNEISRLLKDIDREMER